MHVLPGRRSTTEPRAGTLVPPAMTSLSAATCVVHAIEEAPRRWRLISTPIVHIQIPELEQPLTTLVHAARDEVAVGAEAHGVFPAGRAAEERRGEAR